MIFCAKNNVSQQFFNPIKIQLFSDEMNHLTYLIKQKCIDAIYATRENNKFFVQETENEFSLFRYFLWKMMWLLYWQWKDSSHEFPSWMAVKTSCITPPLPFATPPKNGNLKQSKEKINKNVRKNLRKIWKIQEIIQEKKMMSKEYSKNKNWKIFQKKLLIWIIFLESKIHENKLIFFLVKEKNLQTFKKHRNRNQRKK